MNINDKISGFSVVNVEKVAEIGATLVQMKHQKSGARLLWLDRADNNKTFSIAFRTIPSDDTGIFHILEHSVLCGSKKFDVKEPFVELLKNSMNTFLNALTFPDKTMYPISSKNDKDFFNLMEVYLDAVFYPSIYKKPEIFYQEGWHYEFDENDEISYKGVVFNEMKGVYADADSVQENALCQALFPESCYSVESGGHPRNIPDLTYEKFIEGHKTFYHPSNSYIILDGDMDIQKVCQFIDENYLKDFDAISPCPLPKLQAPIKAERREVMFEQSKDMPIENQSRLNLGYVVGTFEEKEKILASSIITDLLCDSNQSYLTKAVLSKGLAESVKARLVDGIMQPFMSIEIKNIKDGKVDETQQLVYDTIADLLKNGIDKDILEGAISNLEFYLKEKEFGYPRGLCYAMTVLETWLYDGDPKGNLEVAEVFNSLRQKSEKGYFEQLLKELILDSKHCAQVVLRPSYTAGDEEREIEQKRLAKIKAEWTKEDIEYYKNEQARLEAWQASEDSPEALAKMPMITLADIDTTPEEMPLEVDGNILKHKENTDGITYVKMYFDISGVAEADLPKLSLMSDLLGELDTQNYSAMELRTKLMTKCGSVSFSVAPFVELKDNTKGKIQFIATFSALNRYVSDAIELVNEIITNTKFDDKNAIVDIIKQSKMARYQTIIGAGSVVAMKRASASLCFDSVVLEQTNGLAYYQWLKAQEQEPTVIGELPELLAKAFGNDNVTFSVACENPSAYDSELKAVQNALPKAGYGKELCIKPWQKKNEAVVIPGDISFAGLCGDFSGLYSGEAILMAHICSLDYLWNEVRVKGGAYGTGLKLLANDTICAYSYRDPNACGSIKTFGQIADYVKSFATSDKSLVGFIIGAMSTASPLLTPKSRSTASDGNYFSKITFEDRLATRQGIVGANMQQLLALADKVKASIDNSAFCVVGSQKQIDKLEGLDQIYSL